MPPTPLLDCLAAKTVFRYGFMFPWGMKLSAGTRETKSIMASQLNHRIRSTPDTQKQFVVTRKMQFLTLKLYCLPYQLLRTNLS